MKYLNQQKCSTFLLMAVLFMASGCSVQYVADYDASVNEEIIQIAKQVDLFWGELLDTPVADRQYQKFKDQYNRIEVDIRGLVMQNEIRELNKETTKQGQIALDLWLQDRSIHKKNDGFSDFEAKRHRKQFYRVFTAMAKGEEAKSQ